MTQMYRPSVTYRERSVEIKNNIKDNNLPSDNIENVEMRRLIDKVNNFMWKTFNERELDIVINHIILGHSRASMALKYHVSAMRMKTIQERCMKKLKAFLHKNHINSIQDI